MNAICKFCSFVQWERSFYTHKKTKQTYTQIHGAYHVLVPNCERFQLNITHTTRKTELEENANKKYQNIAEVGANKTHTQEKKLYKNIKKTAEKYITNGKKQHKIIKSKCNIKEYIYAISAKTRTTSNRLLSVSFSSVRVKCDKCTTYKIYIILSRNSGLRAKTTKIAQKKTNGEK